MKMDAGIAWVDGNDPQHKAKVERYMAVENVETSPNVIPSRYDSSGEIKYCVLSILKFAPYIHKIYIVCDDQNPTIEEVVALYFPNRLKDIIFVDHQELFEGYEKYLPVFNSRAIESMLWRLPNLSENYLYFNDDFFLIKPTVLTDWIRNNQQVLRGKWKPIPLIRLLWHEVITPKIKKF